MKPRMLSYTKSLMVSLAIIVAVFALAVAAVFSVDAIRDESLNVDAEGEFIQALFNEKYGTDGESQLIRAIIPDKQYVLFRQQGDEVRVSMYIGGLWAEMGILSPSGDVTAE